MAIREKIEKLVQEALLGRATSMDLIKIFSKYEKELEQYEWNTAFRLVKYLEKMKKGELTKEDFLVSLRNYLLLFKNTVTLGNELCFSEAMKYGIIEDFEGNYYCSLDTPDYLQEAITKQAFMWGEEKKNRKKDYFLGVSPYINHLTGFKYFKSIEQKLAVNGALNTPAGYTTLVSLPTGGGKSLITQAIAYQKQRGLTVVIVPTVSLVMDQVRAATNNIKSASKGEILGYDSEISNSVRNQLYQYLDEETLRLLFISPEALVKNKELVKRLEEANERKYIRNIVIDEAHIVMDWGNFFRVDYQCLEPWRKKILQGNGEIRTFLLSATFVKDAVEGLKEMFANDDKWIEIRCDKLRHEPRFQVVKAESYSDKNRKIIELMRYLPRPMVVYVSSPDKAEEVGQLAQQNGLKNFALFTGKTKNDQRRELIEAWAGNEMDMMIATSAFGVGIDKKDIRSVLHLYIPESPNAYYQELGRGGRDGLPCLSVMLTLVNEDLTTTFKKLGKVPTPKKILGRWETMLRSRDTKWFQDLYSIDTTVKPNYNSSDEYAEDASKRDIQWNIYVLLLLRRYHLIEIDELVLNGEDKYQFIIRITEAKILQCDEETDQVFSKIRDEEWKKTKSEFKKMKHAICNSENECLSEMFYKTYTRVDEYCAGCNTHFKIIEVHTDNFPQLKKITKPLKRCEPRIQSLFSNDREVLVLQNLLSEDVYFSGVLELAKKGVDLLVLDEVFKEKYISILSKLVSDCDIQIIGIDEVAALLENCAYYYLTATAMVWYDDEENSLYKKIRTMQKAGLESGLKIIHVMKRNSFLPQVNKRVTEVIDGHELESYLLGKV